MDAGQCVAIGLVSLALDRDNHPAKAWNVSSPCPSSLTDILHELRVMHHLAINVHIWLELTGSSTQKPHQPPSMKVSLNHLLLVVMGSAQG